MKGKYHRKGILLGAAGFLLLSCCVTSTEESMTDPPPVSRIDRILQLAQTAASSHNSQPWRLEQIGTGVYQVIAVQERWLREVDPEKREYLLSIGAYLENLTMAAHAYGCEIDMEILLTNPDDLVVSRFTLHSQTGEIDDSWITLMASASMNKTGYEKSLAGNSGFTSRLERNEHFIWAERESPLYSALLEGTIEASRIQAWNDKRQRELADYICYSEEERDYGVGMTPAMLNLPGFMSRSWYRRSSPETVMSRFFRNGAVSKARKLMKNTAGLVLISSEDNSPASLLECGGVFQRFYWESKEAGIEIHPLSQILEEEPWKSRINVLAGSRRPVQFVLRAGEADAVSSASIRMSPVSGNDSRDFR